MKEEEETGGASLELGLWYRSPPLTQALKAAQVRDFHPVLHLDLDCTEVFFFNHYCTVNREDFQTSRLNLSEGVKETVKSE